MAYSERLAERIRVLLGEHPNVEERKMFGGLCFLVGNHMVCGIVGDELMVRVGPDGYEEALSRKHARPMDFTGKPMRGMVYVATEGIKTRASLSSWLHRGVSHAQSLPPKRAKARKASPRSRPSKKRTR